MSDPSNKEDRILQVQHISDKVNEALENLDHSAVKVETTTDRGGLKIKEAVQIKSTTKGKHNEDKMTNKNKDDHKESQEITILKKRVNDLEKLTGRLEYELQSVTGKILEMETNINGLNIDLEIATKKIKGCEYTLNMRTQLKPSEVRSNLKSFIEANKKKIDAEKMSDSSNTEESPKAEKSRSPIK